MKLGEETFEGTKEMIDVVFTITIYLIALICLKGMAAIVNNRQRRAGSEQKPF